jgi:hypothetical protein
MPPLNDLILAFLTDIYDYMSNRRIEHRVACLKRDSPWRSLLDQMVVVKIDFLLSS